MSNRERPDGVATFVDDACHWSSKGTKFFAMCELRRANSLNA
jgi:hypothetical protein